MELENTKKIVNKPTSLNKLSQMMGILQLWMVYSGRKRH